MAVINRRAAVAVAAAGALLAGAAAWFTVPYGTTHVHPTYAVTLETAGKASAWADDVFVATVKKQSSTERTEDELLWTTFDVEVESTLKGQVSGTVRVAQEGGDDPLTRERTVVGDAPPLEPGKTYVLATRVSSDGWHLSPSNFTPVEIPGTGGRAQASAAAGDGVVSRWESAVRNPEAQENLLPSEADEAADPSALYKRAEAG
ncbi:hypothetical protein I3F58_01905 [Streptomyces sp. MUM 203J]|uniref:hypothetical protein n=1 Tax=Streptomyces sp. MUM 203J TaxID=2791990 RepID=UPI001F03C79B|nr:hypothetical protein [Streptomyces sp. MUM 203J]MCH0538335.1 hypothetical protein [Streptomyces sp. MUM 203J]